MYENKFNFKSILEFVFKSIFVWICFETFGHDNDEIQVHIVVRPQSSYRVHD